MADYVADTMAIVSYFAQRRLSETARQILRDADSDHHHIYFSAVTLMEILYLSEARRISLSPAELMKRISESSNYIPLPLTVEVVLTASTIDDVREMHDRLIAATAKYYNYPLLTNDPILLKSKHITAVW